MESRTWEPGGEGSAGSARSRTISTPTRREVLMMSENIVHNLEFQALKYSPKTIFLPITQTCTFIYNWNKSHQATAKNTKVACTGVYITPGRRSKRPIPS